MRTQAIVATRPLEIFIISETYPYVHTSRQILLHPNIMGQPPFSITVEAIQLDGRAQLATITSELPRRFAVLQLR